jgi:hypothetical protein
MIAIEGKVWRGRHGYSSALAWPVLRDISYGGWLSTIFIY